MASVPVITRPFQWGVVLVGDASSGDLPTTIDERGFATTATTLAIAVRHAQDVDFENHRPDDLVPPFEVEVTVTLGEPPPQVPAVEIEVPSGVIAIGDADAEDQFAVRSRRCRVGVADDDPQHAERVSIWLAEVNGP